MFVLRDTYYPSHRSVRLPFHSASDLSPRVTPHRFPNLTNFLLRIEAVGSIGAYRTHQETHHDGGITNSIHNIFSPTSCSAKLLEPCPFRADSPFRLKIVGFEVPFHGRFWVPGDILRIIAAIGLASRWLPAVVK